MRIPSFKTNGFTLVETLVVLVLLGLILSILFQGIGLIGKVNERLIPKLQQQQLIHLQQLWFRDTVSGLVAGFNANEMFHGSEIEFGGLTVNSLASEVIAPAVIKWSISPNNSGKSLIYQQGKETHWNIQDYPSESKPQFAYLNSKGKWLSKWIPQKGLNQGNQLPEAISLHFFLNQHEFWWIATVYGEKNPPGWLQNYEE